MSPIRDPHPTEWRYPPADWQQRSPAYYAPFQAPQPHERLAASAEHVRKIVTSTPNISESTGSDQNAESPP